MKRSHPQACCMDKSHGPRAAARGYKRVGWQGEGKLADPAQAKGGGGGCGGDTNYRQGEGGSCGGGRVLFMILWGCL